MPRARKTTKRTDIDSLRHAGERRANIPTEELRDFVAADEAAPPAMLYPRDPSLDPQLVWKGKDEQDRSDLEMPVVPIYIQEKVHPEAIIEDFLRTARLPGDGIAEDEPVYQYDMFADFNGFDEEDFGKRLEFYSHDDGSRPHWSNRMILGDSLLVMTSLAEKEGLKGQVQLIYIDPPYGIKFGSNWQVSTRKRDVKDGRAGDLTRQPEQVRAFRDTWQLGIHSYLSYLRDRLVVSRELLTETGSVFVQIGDENVHLVRAVMDEVFGSENFCSSIAFVKTSAATSALIAGVYDTVLWYAKSREVVKYRQLYYLKTPGAEGATAYTKLQLADGLRRNATEQELSGTIPLPDGARIFATDNMTSQRPPGDFPVSYNGRTYRPVKGYWKTGQEGLSKLIAADRIETTSGGRLSYVRFLEDFPAVALTNVWTDTLGQNQFGGSKVYVVQTQLPVIQRCMLMTTDPGDLILDPTCGSGTTAYVSEQWGRRWITIDTSRVALALARTRLMSAKYPYYHLADDYPDLPATATNDDIKAFLRNAPVRGGVGDIKKGFINERVPHIMLKSIANNPEIDAIHEKWQPQLDALKAEINTAAGKKWEEWEIPRPDDLPKDLRGLEDPGRLLERWWHTRRKRQTEIDNAIARHADTEILYDKPFEDNKRLRVAGPFTVESLSPHRTLSADEPDPVGGETSDFATMILDNLRKSGVQNTIKNERLKFDRLDPYPGQWLQAAGEYTESDGTVRRVAVSLGPEHGTVSPQQIKEAAKEAVQGLGFDVLCVCGFAFDPHVNEEATRYGQLTVLPVRMNPDLAMGDELLKKTGAGNLFMIFGEPDLKVESNGDGQIEVELRGLDIFDPTTGEVRASSPDEIAAWFIDTDYNDESFFVRHAYFTGADEPYDQLKRALRAEVDEDAWQQLYRTRSRPFDRPESGKFAVKVINHFGDEVLKVYTL